MPLLKVSVAAGSTAPLIRAEVVIHGDDDLLFHPKILFGRLNRRVPEQEPNMFQITATFTAQLRSRSSEVIGTEARDADLFGRLFDDQPDGPVAEGLAADLACDSRTLQPTPESRGALR